MATVDKGGTIEKGVFTQDEFMEKIKAERATYQAIYGGRNRGRLTSISYFTRR